MEGTNWIKLMSIKAIIGTAEKGEKIEIGRAHV